MLPARVPQFLPLSGASVVQPVWGGESGSHCHQPAASASQRDPEQRRAAESNQQGTQVSHLTTCGQWCILLVATEHKHAYNQGDVEFVSPCVLCGQASLPSLSVSFFSPPETLRGETAPGRPRGDRWPNWWASGSYTLSLRDQLFSLLK